MESEKEIITLEFAQEINLVPRVSKYQRDNKVDYSTAIREIVNTYCFDKEKRLCKFTKDEILKKVEK